MTKTDALEVLRSHMSVLIEVQKLRGADAEKLARFAAESDTLITKAEGLDDAVFAAIPEETSQPQIAKIIASAIAAA